MTSSEKIRHIVEPETGKWYHMDERNRVWTCGCKEGIPVSICISICDCLKDEGELREVKSQINRKRKELGLLMGEKYGEN